jgi:hypothetical protein
VRRLQFFESWQDFLVPTSKLTWLQATVRKCYSGAKMSGIWPWAKYKSCRILSHPSNGYLHALIQSTVYELWVLEVEPGCWNSVIDRIEHLKKSELLTPIWIQSQKTFNTNIVDSVLNFFMHPYTTYSVKQNQSYSDPKTAWINRFQQKVGNRFNFGARVRISSRTQLKEQFGQKLSMAHDLFRLGLNFKFGAMVQELQFLEFEGCCWKF